MPRDLVLRCICTPLYVHFAQNRIKSTKLYIHDLIDIKIAALIVSSLNVLEAPHALVYLSLTSTNKVQLQLATFATTVQ